MGTAAAGTATTFARSDHVHPVSRDVCMDYFTGNCDRPVVITTRDNTTCNWTCGTVGAAVACKLTFNPATGVLRATCFYGIALTAQRILKVANACTSCPVYVFYSGTTTCVCNKSGAFIVAFNGCCSCWINNNSKGALGCCGFPVTYISV